MSKLKVLSLFSGIGAFEEALKVGGHLPSLLEIDTRENKHSCGYGIRKITPRETWRLQSFSDEDFDKVQAAGISNTQLYKLAGNGVTINVIDALAKNINELHKTLSKRNTKVYNKEEVSV